MSEDKKMITLTIDGETVSVPEGTTIMNAAEELDIHIPRLCYHPDLSLAGSCRVCIVEVKGIDFFVTSCCWKVSEGMEVQSSSPEIRRARRDIVELLLDNHTMDCQTCARDTNCELQSLAYSLGVRERFFEGKRKDFEIDDSSLSIIRNPQKCILCGRCVRVCSEVQGVHNLSQHSRGFNTVVGPAHMAKMDESSCIQCGQCVNVCPTAALMEKTHVREVWAALADPDKHVVVQVAPSIRAAIGEAFGMEPGTPCTGKTVTALRRLGFDTVFDTNFSADLTIVEEAHEFLGRLKNGGPLPILTSCSPGWVSFMERFYPDLIPHASSCKSPMSMMSSLVKTYYADKVKIDPKDIFNVAIMPCVAKKYEAGRPEHQEDFGPTTDAVLTTRELAWMIKCYGITFEKLPDGEWDSPLGFSTGAADIFGCTGGVMEATLRTAAEIVTGRPATQVEFKEVRAVEGLRECTIQVGDQELRVGVANGLTNAKILLDKVRKGEEQFHIIEVMACPGGCICGGGQPYPPKGVKVLDPELCAKRASALYSIDEQKTLRLSHRNPDILDLYESFLGEPNSEKAHEVLHTSYKAKEPRGI